MTVSSTSSNDDRRQFSIGSDDEKSSCYGGLAMVAMALVSGMEQVLVARDADHNR